MKYTNYNYDPRQSIVYRDLKDSKHLVWRPPYNGVPAFNADIINQYKKIAKWVGYRFGDQTYKIPMEYLLDFRHIINYQGEVQYILPKSDWAFFN